MDFLEEIHVETFIKLWDLATSYRCTQILFEAVEVFFSFFFLSFRLIVCMCTQSLLNPFCFTGLGLKFGLTIQENHNMHSFKQRLLNGYNGQSDNRNVRTKNLSISKTHLSTSVSTNLCFCVVLM